MSLRCPLCPSTGRSKNDLLRHMTICHRSEKSEIVFSCFLCQNVFQNFDCLKVHLETNHADIIQPKFFAWEESEELKLLCKELLLEAAEKCNLEDALQLKAAEVLYNLRDEGNATQRVIDSVINGSNVLLDMVLDIVQSQFCILARKKHGSSLTVNEICSTLSGFRHNSFYEGLQTEVKFEKFLKSKNWLVAPNEEVLEHKEVVRKDLSVETIPLHVGYVVPFLSLLEKLLNIPEVLHCVDNPKPTKEGEFATPLDGYYYRNMPFVKKHPGALAFGTYGDDVKLTDTASTKPVNARLFYWSLLNIFPELRSQLDAINLLFCAQTEIVKQYGYRKFLEDYVMGVKKLSHEGVTFNVMRTKRDFRGVHLFSSGDNPFSSNLAGTKESHFADVPCRQCLGTKPNIFQIFDERLFTLRSKERHQEQVQEVENFQAMPASVQASISPNPSVAFGINSRSLFMDVPGCDVTKCFPQDLMHDVIHGTLKLEILCLLDHVVKHKKVLSLKIINSRIQKYAMFFGVNKPSSIEARHLENRNLRQSAAETVALAQILPFALLKEDLLSGNIESACDPQNLKCFILRLNILDFEMKFEFSLLDVECLRKMIKVHHELFVQLYPDEVEVPKLHYEIHFPNQILLFGPLRQHWCFRNEGKHAYFKRLCKILHSFINIFLSLAKRHQLRQGSKMFFSVAGEIGPFLRLADSCGVPKVIKVSKLSTSHKDLLLGAFPGIESVNQYRFAVVKGVHYAEKDAFVLKLSKGVPTVGEIVNIYGFKDTIVFIYTELITEEFNTSLNAFKVKHKQKLALSQVNQLFHHHSVFYIRSINAHYVVVPCNSFLSLKFRVT